MNYSHGQKAYSAVGNALGITADPNVVNGPKMGTELPVQLADAVAHVDAAVERLNIIAGKLCGTFPEPAQQTTAEPVPNGVFEATRREIQRLNLLTGAIHSALDRIDNGLIG